MFNGRCVPLIDRATRPEVKQYSAICAFQRLVAVLLVERLVLPTVEILANTVCQIVSPSNPPAGLRRLAATGPPTHCQSDRITVVGEKFCTTVFC